MELTLRKLWRAFLWYRSKVEWAGQRGRSRLKGRSLPGIGLELSLFGTFVMTGLGHILLTLGVIPTLG